MGVLCKRGEAYTPFGKLLGPCTIETVLHNKERVKDMKRVLTATTAIVGMSFAATAAQAEEPISIGLSGFMNVYYGFGGQDDDITGEDSDTRYHLQDATINFSGSTTLDNGLEVGTRFELESFGHPADEQYIYFKGSFGNLTVGSHNSVAYSMSFLASGHHYTAGIPINTGWINYLVMGGSGGQVQEFSAREPGFSTFLDTHNDSMTVSYQTPRFAGFKFGASWSPNAGQSEGETQFGPTATDTQYHDSLSAAVNYTNSFGAATINAAAGLNYAQAGDDQLAQNGTSADDVAQYMGGLNVGFGGFNVGGNIGIQDSEDSGVRFERNDGTAWSLGAGYSTGPWSAAVDYGNFETEGLVANPDDDQTQAVKFGVDYAMGPGIKLSGTIAHAWRDEEGGAEADGTSGVLGTTVTF